MACTQSSMRKLKPQLRRLNPQNLLPSMELVYLQLEALLKGGAVPPDSQIFRTGK